MQQHFFLVVVRRHIMYGPALGVQEAVKEVLRALLADIEITLAVSVAGGNSGTAQAVDATSRDHVQLAE